MRYQFFCLALCVTFLTCGSNAYAQNKVTLSNSFTQPILKELKPFHTPSEGQMEEMLKGEVISTGKVNSPSDTEQEMMMFSSGIHPRNCIKAMRKLSLYENFTQYINFVKQSSYDNKTEKVTFVMDHTLLPFPMILTFKLPRITKPGHYPFTFDHGFLKSLKGTVGVADVGKYCLLTLKADWRGPETKIPNLAFEAFVQTIGKMGLEHLIRVSRF